MNEYEVQVTVWVMADDEDEAYGVVRTSMERTGIPYELIDEAATLVTDHLATRSRY